MKINLTIAGRYLFAVPMFVFGLFHFMNGKMMVESFIPDWLPLKLFFVYLIGAGLIAAAVSFVFKVYARLAGLLLALLLLMFIVLLWLPGIMAGNQDLMSMLLKDLGLLGGALMVAGQFKK